MRFSKYLLFLTFSVLVFQAASLRAQRVGINTTSPDASSVLDVNSTTGGLLVPRLSTVQRNAIATPAAGLMIYNTTTACFEIYNGTTWKALCGADVACDYSNLQNLSSLTIAPGSTGNLTVTFSTVAGTPGKVTTVLDNITPIAGVGLTSVTNQTQTIPAVGTITQTLTLSVTAAVATGTYSIRFRHDTDCGVSHYTYLTLSVSNCGFSAALSPSSMFFYNGSTNTISTTLTITQTGAAAGTASVSVGGSFTGISSSFPVSSSCSYTCPITINMTVASGTVAGTYTVPVTVTSTCGTVQTVNLTLTVAPNYRMCKDILTYSPGSPSGTYTIDPDALGSGSPMSAYCDLTTDGGGWTCVLNYIHKGTTNPALDANTTALPIPAIPFPVAADLGTDESTNAASWGHTAPTLLNQLSFTEVRFYGRTSAHARVINFKTSETTLVNYFKLGTGGITIANLASGFTPLTGHTAVIPAGANSGFSNQGTIAMTSFPFYATSANHWGIAGSGNRWEVDDFPGNFNNHTIHQIWVR